MFLALGVPPNAISTNPKILGCELTSRRKVVFLRRVKRAASAT